MLLDARSVTSGATVDADICIVGAGPAGITTALGLRDSAACVLLLEGGGERPADEPQTLCRGTTSGRPYHALDSCRLRSFGGSTHVWGGWCCPLEAIDFEERTWLPHSGWPFPRAELDAYYRRAQEVCRLGPYAYDASYWHAGRTGLVTDASGVLRDTVFHIAPTRFGAEYGSALRGASNVGLMLHGHATEIEMDVAGRTAERVHVGTIGGNRFTIRCRIVVLAAGGIENARLLLASRRHCRCGIGNEHDLVGRFFADHLHAPIGVLRPSSEAQMSFYVEHRRNGTMVRGGIALSEEVRRRERLPGLAATLHNSADPHDVLSPTEQPRGYESLAHLWKSVLRGERPSDAWRHACRIASDPTGAASLALRKLVKPRPRTFVVGIRAEQAPNANSRVTLDDEMDPFGMPRARLHWDVTTHDVERVEQAIGVWRGGLARAGLALLPLPGPEPWSDRIAGGAHHTGTTRMHRDPSRGVVDEHGRVHGTSNVYAAGSSVFPTAGWAPPTLTIVALALRLAEHLREQGAGSREQGAGSGAGERSGDFHREIGEIRDPKESPRSPRSPCEARARNRRAACTSR